MSVFYATHTGLVRADNQDSLLCLEIPLLLAVADGMGGHRGGRRASELALEVLERELSAFAGGSARLAMRQAFEQANQQVLQAAQADATLAGMGTTMCVLWRVDDDWIIGNVGDSRAYRLGSDGLEQITRDDTAVAEMVRTGKITQEQSQNHPSRHLLTQAVGTVGRMVPQIFALPQGERFLLCSDGLYTHVSDQEIAAALGQQNDGENIAAELVALALERGGSDNVTVVVAVP